VADVRDAGDDLRSVGEALRRELQGVVRDYRGELARSVVEVRQAAEEARGALREASSGGWVAPMALLLVATGVVLSALAKGGLAAAGPYLVLLAVGLIVGWWARG
jgi:hypothetical protein